MERDNGRIYYGVALDNSSLRAGASEAKSILTGIGRTAVSEGDAMDKAFGRLRNAVVGAFAAERMMEFGKQLATVRGEFQKLEVAFGTMLGSKEKADALMSQLVQTAATTPFQMSDVANSAKQLLAFGMDSERVNETLIRLGDIAAGLSIPIGDLAYLFGTTMVQGRLYTQDFNQFLSRGIPIADELAKQFGVTKDKVKGLVEEGKVGFPQIEKAIVALTSEGGKFGGLMEAQSKTIAGQLSNLEDSIEQMMNEIGKNSQGIITRVIGAASSLVENYERVGRAVMGLVGTYGVYRAAVIVNAAAVKGWTIAELAHFNALVLVEKAQKLLNRTMLANPYVLVATAVAGLVAVMMTMKTEQERIREAEERYNEEKQKTIEAEQKHLDEMNKICDLAGEEAASTDDRRKALVRLRQEYPSILDKYKSEEDALRSIKQIKQEIAELEGKRSISNPRNELASVEAKIKQLEERKDFYNKSNTQAGAKIAQGLDEQLKPLYSRRTALQGQIRQDEVDTYFADLTGISNKELANEINVRRGLLAKMNASGNHYGVITGSRATSGKYSKDQLQGQLQSLEAEHARRGEKRFDPSHYAAEAKKRYDAALKAYNDFLKSKNKYSADEYERERDRLKAELDAAKKEVDKNKPAPRGNKPTKSPTPPKKEVDDTAKREAQEREEAEKNLASSLKALQEQNIDDLIALREDETERKLAQIDRDWAKQKAKIEEQAEEWKALNKKVGAKTGADGLTADQRTAVTQATTNNDVSRTRRHKAVIAEEKAAAVQTQLQHLRDNLQLDKIFGDLDTVGTEALKRLQGALEDFIKTNKDLSPDQVKDLAEALRKIKEEMKERSPFASFKSAIEGLVLAQRAYNQAVKEGNQADKEAAKEAKLKAQAEATRAKNAVIKDIAQYNDAAQSIIDSLEQMGVKIPQVLKDITASLGEVLDGLASIDLTKPLSIVTGVFKTIGGLFNFGRIFGSENREWERLSAQYDNLSSVWDDLIAKKREYVSTSYGQEVSHATEEIKSLYEAEIKGLDAVARARLTYRKKGEHSVGYNMWRGKGKHKGYAWKDIAGGVSEILGREFKGLGDLIGMTQEQWEELVKRYPEYVANLDADFLKYLEEIRGKEEAIKAAAEAETEKWTGFTADTMLDEFLSGLKDMDKSAADFAHDFEGYLVNAVINAMLGERYKPRIEALTKEWEKAMKDGKLTKEEADKLKKMHSDITNDAIAEREAILSVTGGGAEGQREGVSKGIATASQDSVDELNGRATAIQSHTYSIAEHTKSLLTTANLILKSVVDIEANTADMRADMHSVKAALDDITLKGVKLK